eukprot:10290727-Alexandrium_andersonii.AAC.1
MQRMVYRLPRKEGEDVWDWYSRHWERRKTSISSRASSPGPSSISRLSGSGQAISGVAQRASRSSFSSGPSNGDAQSRAWGEVGVRLRVGFRDA